MRITFLGTTAAVPTRERNHTSIALHYMNEIILLDCGEGTQNQMVKAKVSFMKIKKIFITHFHGDHFLGLPGLIQTMSLNDRSEPLYIYGPKGIDYLVEIVKSLGAYDLNFEIIPVEIKNNFKIEEKHYTIKCVEVEHNIETYGIIFEEKKGREFLLEKALALGLKPSPLFKKLQEGKEVIVNGRVIKPDDVLGEQKKGFKVVYSSDTRPCRAIEENCKDAVLIHDSTFDDTLKEDAKEKKHSTCVEAAEIAKRGGAKELYLTHISPRYKDDSILAEQARKIFENVHVAKDLMQVELSLRKPSRIYIIR